MAHLRTPSGRVLHLDRTDPRAQRLLELGGSFNPYSDALWQLAVRSYDWDLILDIGANYGEMLIHLDPPGNTRVICYEPNPQVLPFLRRTIAENNLDVEVRAVAVGQDVRPAAQFGIDRAWSGKSSLHPDRKGSAQVHVIDVQQTSIDQELQDLPARTVCIKVDVEGAEDEVLAGADRLLRGPLDWLMMIEVLHASDFWLAELSQRFDLHFYIPERDSLFTVPPLSPHAVGRLIRSGWFYGQDAIITSPRVTETIEGFR